MHTANLSAAARKSDYEDSGLTASAQPEPIAVSIKDAAKLSGIGRSTLYVAIARGDLPIKKCGSRSVILMTDLREWLDSLPGFDSHAA